MRDRTGLQAGWPISIWNFFILYFCFFRKGQIKMKINQLTAVLLASMVLLLTSCEEGHKQRQAGGAVKVETANSARVKALFRNPPRRYSSGPLWVWNDMLTEEQIVSTLRDLAGQKVRQVFVHPRPGLMTPYLSDDWFRLWKVALQEAKRLDMNVWIYDENSYPSGFAGGFVPDAMPESRGRGLHIRQVNQPPELSDDVVGVYELDGDSFENVTKKIRSGRQLPESRYLVASVRRAGNSPWYGNKCYVDLLYPGVTEKFLEVTMDAYRRRVGDEFGRRVPGVFTDEPHLRPAGGFPWTDDLPKAFRKRWGYSLLDSLPSLSRPVGDFKRVRHNYFQLVLELFIERWGRPYYEYCQKYGIEFTGHYWEHEWPNCISVPDNMAMSAWQQRQGIDTLMNQYNEGTHAQFGNIRAVKELSSLANQLGRKRTICEAYGAGGWDLRFEDMKRIGDWLYVLGINTLNEHLSYITVRGARKRDHPQSFSYHEPWWPDYHVMASYFTRLSMVLSQGEQYNTVLLIEPTTTAWMYQADSTHREHLGKIGNEFQEMVVALSKAQVEYDIGCEDIIKRHGGVIHADLADKQGRLVDGWTKLHIGYRAYDTVVIPPYTENLNASTVRLLKQCIGHGGTRVLCCGDPPTLIEGQLSDRPKKLAERSNWQRIEPDDLPAKLLELSDGKFAIRRSQDDNGILLSHRRRLDGGDIVFLVNTSIDSPSSGRIESTMKSVEQWNPETGNISSYPYEENPNGINADFELPPCGSLLLFLSKRAAKPVPSDSPRTSKIEAAGPLRINRTDLNVLTLDFVDITAGGETKSNVYFYQANQFAFQKNGMDRNPWDSAVQFRDELITKEFAAGSGFEATYRFTIENEVPAELFIVIERPDLYSITCNDKAISAAKGSWWLDKVFGKIDIADNAKAGENTVTLKASPMTIYHELESAYILGDFALKPVDSGFVIVPEVPMKLGPWNKQDHPFYAAGLSYEQNFNIARPAGRYYVRLPDWYGSVAKVFVNGKPAGHIYCQPWECDVTESISKGSNTIEVVVIGTLKNTLGPHHGNHPLGSAWPGMFHSAPETGPPAGDRYSTVGYGLFEPFELHKR
jgi:hypothetical protein